MNESATTKHRLFLGLPLPADAASSLAEAAQREWSLTEIRLVSAENLHVTLIFFGDVNADGRDELIRLTREIRWTPFPVQIGEVALFGRTAIAVRLKADRRALSELDDRLVQPSIRITDKPSSVTIAERRERLHSSKNPFYEMLRHMPDAELEKRRRRDRKGEALDLHVTVARAKMSPHLPTHLVEQNFELDRVVLFESFLQPSGSRYVPLAESPIESASSLCSGETVPRSDDCDASR